MSTITDRMTAAHKDESNLWEVLRVNDGAAYEVIRWHSDPCDDDYDVMGSSDDSDVATVLCDGFTEAAAMRAALKVAVEAFQAVDSQDWSMLKVIIDDSAHGKFWKDILRDFRRVVEEAK